MLALTLVSFGLLPVACTQDFSFFGSSQGTGGSGTSSSSGTMSSSSSSNSSSSGTPGCMVDGDCNDQISCTTDTCDTTTHKCSNVAIPDGPPPGYTDTVQDCKTQKCVGGVEQTVAADTDVPPSGNPCVTNACANMAVVMSDVNTGTGCGNNQTCDGQGNCVGCLKNNDCMSPGTCKGVTCDVPNKKCVVTNDTPGTTCTGGGGAKVCDGSGNCVGCVVPSDCQSGNCTAGHTCGLALDGHACTQGNQCNSGHCANGVCCDQTCNTTCRACTKALTGQANDGTCGDVTAGTAAPTGQCAAATCGNTGNCGAGATCEQAMSGSMCSMPMCTNGTLTGAGTCGGGTCNPGGSSMCGAYKCNGTGTACRTTCGGSGDCATGNFCDGTGHCAPQVAIGLACPGGAAQCTSGNCVDGVCCNNACAGTCVACTAAKQNAGGVDGTCGPAKDGTDPHVTCAAQSPLVCGNTGTCTAGACTEVAAATTCAASCTDGGNGSTQTAAGTCNGTGTCSGATMSCGNYKCGGTTCRTTCNQSSDCKAGHFCNGGNNCI